MLTFEEKLAIIETFPELKRKDVSMKRVNFQYEESVREKKNVVFHLHPNGNGFVYAQYLDGYVTDEKGMVNIRDFSAGNLKRIIRESIESLSSSDEKESDEPAFREEWINENKQILVLMEEYDMWNVYAGLNLDGTFNSYGEAAAYLDEEGFRKK
ncbi:MAG TPA: hypothetical protein VIG80_13795 [Bacillaceae bacterium]